jgi:hypothetical protein
MERQRVRAWLKHAYAELDTVLTPPAQ